MAREKVHVSALVPRPAGEVWAILSDFCGAWHPFIERIEAEAGGWVRRFTLRGEAGLYREALCLVSDSDRVLTYRHLEGIAGAQDYQAEVRVSEEGGGARVDWVALVEADAPRAVQIAQGTAQVFEAGLKALALAALPRACGPAAPAGAKPLTDLRLGGLGLTVSPDRPGDLLLFLHGIGGNRGNWRRQMGPMGGLVRCAAMDFRGYGDSLAFSGQTRVEDYCQDILQLADALGAERLILCGMSYGAWVASSFAMRHPGRLAGLVLAGGCTGMSEAKAPERRAFLEARLAPLDRGETPADFAPGVVQIIAGPRAGPELREELRASMAAIPAQTYRDAVTCFTHPAERFDFSRLGCPVLMLTGAQDRLAPPDEIGKVARRISQHVPTRFEVIQGAGHLCNIEAPLEFNAQLARFVQAVAP